MGKGSLFYCNTPYCSISTADFGKKKPDLERDINTLVI
jgi:hypothetical protein